MRTPEEYAQINALVQEFAPKVWGGLSGNGSLRINIDTDVDCYGDFDPHKKTEPMVYDKVADAQDWVEYFVRSTISHLINAGKLQLMGEKKE